MIECPECGAQNSDNSTFCTRCGTQFAAPETDTPTQSAHGDPSRLLDEAAELYAASQLDDAADACRAALDANPDLVSARSLLGMIEEDRGNHSAALAEYEAVLRLAPERTAERDRADRLRALLRDEAGSAVAEPEGDDRLRRWIPVAIAVVVGLIVLLVGGAIMKAVDARREPPPDALVGPQTGLDASLAAQQPGPMQQAPVVGTINPGASPMGRPIGPTGRDESALQPGQRTQGQSRRRTTVRSGVQPIPDMPPSTTDPNRAGPLEIPRANITVPDTTTYTPPSPAPDLSPTQPARQEPVMQQPRGRVRIWVGDGPAPAPQSSAGGSTSSAAARAQTAGRRNLPTTAGSRQTSPGTRSVPSSSIATSRPAHSSRSRQPVVTSGARTGPAASTVNANRLSATRRQSDGRRTSVAVNPGSSGGGQVLAPSGRRGSQPTQAGARPYSGGYAGSRAVRTNPGNMPSTSSGGARPLPGSGRTSASATRPVETAPAPATRGASSAGSGSSGQAVGLRSRAQQAHSTGRLDDARALYRSAIQNYRADGARNPGRAAANSSAIESCQRALEAIDAAQ